MRALRDATSSWYNMPMMAIVKESPEIPTPEDVRAVLVRTVDDQPAVVLVLHDGQRIVVPVSLRQVSTAVRVAA